jgi:hypothetical protein
VATIPSFFSAVGGFMTVTFTIAGLVLFRIQSMVYYQQLVKSLYKFIDDEDKGTKDSKVKDITNRS